MELLDIVTIVGITLGSVAGVGYPIFRYFWSQDKQQVKDIAEIKAAIRANSEAVNRLHDDFVEEKRTSEKQHNRMERKIDDLCERTARLEGPRK